MTFKVTHAAGDKVTGTSSVTVGDLAVAAGRLCNGPDQTGWCWQRPLPQGQTLNAFEFVSDAVGWAAGSVGEVFKTVAGGTTWQSMTLGVSEAISALSARDVLVAWAWVGSRTLITLDCAAPTAAAAGSRPRARCWLTTRGLPRSPAMEAAC